MRRLPSTLPTLGPRLPRRPRTRCCGLLGTVAVLALLASVLAPAPAAARDPAQAQDSARETLLRPPTSAPILDGFRAPDNPYGPGNRGIEYATAPGDPIVAAGPGQVVFAGPVAGRLYITVDHGGGLLSSYSYLESLAVSRGQQVAAGQRIAVASGPMHFGTRIHGSYVDPATLFGVRKVTVALVPHHDPDLDAAYLDLVERSERLQYLLGHEAPAGGLGGLLARIGGVVRDLVAEPFVAVDVDAFRNDLAVAVEALAVMGADVNPFANFAEFSTAIAAALLPVECSAAGVAAPPLPAAKQRIAVTVAGLDSSTAAASSIEELDLAALGYSLDNVVHAGYRLAPDGATDYTPADTHRPVAESADVLRRQLQEIAAKSPGAPIDVYAHSLGGVVAVAALSDDDIGGLVDSLVTFASPHGGTPTAELANAIGSADPLAAAAEPLPLSDLLGAPVLDDLDGPANAQDSGLPASLDVLTLAQRGDPIVPAHLASLPGHRHVILDRGLPLGGHGSVAGDPAALREIRLARAGLPPGCEGTVDRVLDAVLPRAIAKTSAVAADSVRVADVFLSWGDDAGAVGEWRR